MTDYICFATVKHGINHPDGYVSFLLKSEFLFRSYIIKRLVLKVMVPLINEV